MKTIFHKTTKLEMLNLKIRLEHGYLFPEDKSNDILDYLMGVSPKMLRHCMGAATLKEQRNYHNFISYPEIQQDVINRVKHHFEGKGITNEVIAVSREASLRLVEIILSNKELLLETEREVDKQLEELNFLKCYFLINEELNAKQGFSTSEENFDKIVDNLIVMLFPSSDLGIFEDSDLEFGKLVYATIVKVELLIEFIQSQEEYSYLEEDLCKYFNQKNSADLSYQMKFLFGMLLGLRRDNLFKLGVDIPEAGLFLDSLIAESVVEVEDFTNLKNYPLYKIDEHTYSIVDYFFILDKFFKSVKFILKDSFNTYHGLDPKKDRTFFNFYNKEFFEKFLVKRILNQLFHFKYYIKSSGEDDDKGEPDYYIRHNNRIYLFEVKDVMIAGGVKSSANIDQIEETLKKKFLIDGKKQVGIGQLVRSIKEIVDNNFQFDDYVNKKANLTIYPILLVSERIFEIPGINYRLNQWYLELVQEKLGESYNPNFIKNLTLIDIDTLIYWLPHLEKNNKNFRILLNTHLRLMNTRGKVTATEPSKFDAQIKKNLIEQLSPISNRFPKYAFPREQLLEKYHGVVREE